MTPLPFWTLEQPAGRVALVDETGRAVSYAELAAAADVAVSGLPPHSVFALSPAANRASVAAYLGGLRRHAVPLLLDPQLDGAERDALLRRYGITRWFDGRSQVWQRLPAGRAAPTPHAELALLLSTSGSTASPKLVRLSRDNLAANAGSIVEYLALDASEVAITTLPLHYSFGLSVLNSHLACGACVVLSEAAVTQGAFWQQMRAHRVTSLSGVPTLWRLLRRLRFERMALPALRTLTQAGGRLEPDEIRGLADAAEAQGWQLFVMYGQTEAAPRIAYLPPALLRSHCGSIGVPVPGGRLRVVDADGRTITEPGVTGELAYRGPNVMMGYAEGPEELAQGPGVAELFTGDLGHVDADGCHWITGRAKRFVKMFGHRVSLDELEQRLRAQGLDAAVVGRDDCLRVAVAGIDAARAATLHKEIASHHRWLPAAVHVHALEMLPMASNGKLPYGTLLTQLEEQPAAQPEASPEAPRQAPTPTAVEAVDG